VDGWRNPQPLVDTRKRRAVEDMAGVSYDKLDAAVAERWGALPKLVAKIGQLAAARDLW